MAYASGTLTRGMALLVDCHVERCDSCMEKIRSAERVGGDLLQQINPVEMKAGAWDELSAQLDLVVDIERAEEVEQFKSSQSEVPSALASLIGTDLENVSWKRMGVGVQQYDLGLGGTGAARLLRIQPGVSVPHHTHSGNELTLILRGSYTDEVGRFCAGDVADLDDRIEHQPIVDTSEECICLIATDSPLKFTGLMGKLVQPFIGL